MGRLPIVTVVLCALGAGSCDDQPKPTTTRARTDAVTGRATGKTATAAPSAAPAPKAPRKICAGQTKRDGPEAIEDARAASGATKPGTLELGKRWVWINVWAAWCEPCKKEMPMLIAWRDQLRKAGIDLELAFVSIDDDERELTRFLDKQPETGVRASYWIPDGDARQKWFESIGKSEIPPLPVHAFVDPDGKLACVAEGTLEPTDLPSVKRLLGAR
jgi:thiol-disulfide isomerase/thioredoxin